MDGTIMSIGSLDVWVAPVVRCLLRRENRKEHGQKEYGDTEAKIVDTSTRQLIWSVREFMKHWFCTWSQ